MVTTMSLERLAAGTTVSVASASLTPVILTSSELCLETSEQSQQKQQRRRKQWQRRQRHTMSSGVWAGKYTVPKMGTFSTPSYAGVGEPYVDTMQADTRTQGRQFSTNRPRKGQTGDNWNRTHGRRQGIQVLYEGEKFVDPHTHERKWRLEEGKKNLTSNGFAYSNPNKKSSGLGNYWGCIGKKFEHKPEFDVLTKEQKPVEVVHELRQVLTNPAKQGYGYSTPGIAFGPPFKTGEEKVGKWGSAEYMHSVDPYDMARQFENAERKFNNEAIAGRPAFRTVSHSLDFFDHKKGVASSAVYTEEPRVPERPVKEDEGKAVSSAPFYPARAPKSGHVGAFNKFPKYIEDPLDDKLKAARAAAEAARAIIGNPFKPPQKPKTMPQKSILFHQPGPQLA